MKKHWILILLLGLLGCDDGNGSNNNTNNANNANNVNNANNSNNINNINNINNTNNTNNANNINNINNVNNANNINNTNNTNNTTPVCGNAVLEGTEDCDGANLGAATCASVGGGFTGGTLACTANCTFDTAGCTGCEVTESPLTLETVTVADDLAGPAFVTIADVNDDGKPDLVVSSFGTISGMTMPNGTLKIYTQGADVRTWELDSTVFDETANIKFPNRTTLSDLDGDGDLDIILPAGFLACTMGGIGGACGGLMWFENAGGQWIRHDLVDTGSALFYHLATLTDVDGDGITDLVTTGEEKAGFMGSDRAIAQWFRGTDTADRFETTPLEIGAGMGSFPRMFDVDDDGDLDLVSAEYFLPGGAVAWFEREAAPDAQHPAGTWTRHAINTDVGPSIEALMVDDLYGDGATRLVVSNHSNTTANAGDPESAIYVFDLPATGQDGLWNKTKISCGIVSRAGSMFAPQAAPGIFAVGDIDGDGDLDVLVSGDGDDHLYWLEQVTAGNFATHAIEAGFGQAGGTYVIDLDGDGVNEMTATSYENNVLNVYIVAGAK